MPYLEQSDLERRYGADEVAQRLSALPPGALGDILRDTESMIDGYLASQYSIPLTEVPDSVTAAASAIARYKLLGDSVTEHARDEFRDAVAWLRDVASGRVRLQQAATAPGNAPEAVVLMATSARVFARMGRP